MKPPHQHLQFQEVAAWSSGFYEAWQEAQIREQIRTCPTCAKLASWVIALERGQIEQLPDPPVEHQATLLAILHSAELHNT